MFQSRYASKAVVGGRVEYSKVENATWSVLYRRLGEVLPGRAAPEVLAGLERLCLPKNRIPQIPEVNARLRALTGFELVAVPAMIEDRAFFELLAARRFPVATFIRRPAELSYLQEPDVFHEIYGHAPLLTEPAYADAIQAFGTTALALGPSSFAGLQRLFWYTVEFGLVSTAAGVRILGAGISSSAAESVACLSASAEHRRFDVKEALRTDYRIDQLQPRYFVLDGLEELYDLGARLQSILRSFRQNHAA